MSDNKSAVNLHQVSDGKRSGRVQSYSQVAKMDFKTSSLQKNRAINEYRKAIEQTMKTLEEARRMPLRHQD